MTIRFFKKLAPFSALSFDLDDTLYSNHPIMLTTYQKMISFFAQHLPLPAKTHNGQYDHHYWLPFKQQAIKNNPALKHDVTELRRASYHLGITALDIDNQAATEITELALDYFMVERSNFTVPENICQFLDRASQKLPLIAISNGNVDTNAIGIKQYFSHLYHAGGSFQQKPANDMFIDACQQLAIQPKQLLHVGDCGNADIKGALNAGCQTVWVNKYAVGKALKVLPHLEVKDVLALDALL